MTNRLTESNSYTDSSSQASNTIVDNHKTICVSRAAWQALQEIKLIVFGKRSYSDAVVTIRQQLGPSESDFVNNLLKVSPLPSYLIDRAGLSRNSRKAGRSKTIVLSEDAWEILTSAKVSLGCKSLSETILYFYHAFHTLILSQIPSTGALTNSVRANGGYVS